LKIKRTLSKVFDILITSVFKCDKASLQIEIIEFQEDNVLNNLYNEKYLKIESDSTYDESRLKYVVEKKYPTLKLLIMKMYSMFDFMYVCESAFSKINYIKKTNTDHGSSTNNLK